MTHDARVMCGVLLVTVPTIQHGGYFLLRLFSGQMEYAGLGPELGWVVRIGVPLSAILIPLGFFLSVSFTPERPSGCIRSVYAGAVVLAISVLVLGIGLIRA